MRAIITAALILTALIAERAAAAECAYTWPEARKATKKDQVITSYSTVRAYWPEMKVLSAPDWIRVKSASPGPGMNPTEWETLELLGVPRPGTFQVKVRYSNPEKTVVCTDTLRFK